jgi:glycine dehydrogenase subunit 1
VPQPRSERAPERASLPVGPDGAHNPYVGSTAAERRAMLATIGVDSEAALFADIPAAYRDPALRLPPPLSELDLLRELAGLAARNQPASAVPSFLGGGAARHYVPSVVPAILGRSEFYTAYTPYQPEIAQGTLQSAFEYQSMVCELTGMDVANAGMYDGASAFAEACLMAAAVTGRGRIAVLNTAEPRYLATVRAYASGRHLLVETVSAAALALTNDHACLAIQQPNSLGCFEDGARLADAAHAAGALSVVAADALALAMFRAPGDDGADIVTADGQPFGVGLNYGGPSVGLFACRERFVRHMPGRVVGQTRDLDGRTGYVLTLQTREQHIRREKATSNICTSQQLLALGVAVYLATLGPHGLRQLAELCYQRAHYAAAQIAALPGFSLAFRDAIFFNQFVVRCPLPPREIIDWPANHNLLVGSDISDRVPNGLLVCVTELNPRAEIEMLIETLAECAGSLQRERVRR